MYNVSQVAKILNMNPHTIRYYTDNNLVPELKRDKNNNRIFDDEAINWLQGVKALRECGMSLESIKRYINLCLIGDEMLIERVAIVKDQYEKVNIELKKLQECQKYLEDKLSFYDDLLAGKEIIDVTNPGQWK